MVDWRVSSVKACVTEYLQKECGDVNEVALDSDDDKYDGNDNDDNEVNSKVVEIGTREALEMLDRLVHLKDLTKEERNSRGHERQIENNNNSEQKTKPHL